MKKMISILLVAGAGFYTLAWADMDHPMPARTYTKELEQVKRLAGKWSGMSMQSDGKTQPVSVEYRVIAGGSAVEERLMCNSEHEMVDMYDDQDGKLEMTHYCALGNRPHMMVKSADAKQISLEMGPTPGIDASKDQHMHALTLEFKDADHLTQKWTSYENGKAGGTVTFTLARAK